MPSFTLSIPAIGLHDFEGEADVRCIDDTIEIEQIYIDAAGFGRTSMQKMDISTPAYRAFYAMIAEALFYNSRFIADAREELGIFEESANEQAAADYRASVL